MRVAIVGAGTVGCYIGGRLLASGQDVVLVGRERLVREVAEHGLSLSDYRGWAASLPSAICRASSDMGSVRGADVVLVTVKSADTKAVADQLRGLVAGQARVVSLQNGVLFTRAAKHMLAIDPAARSSLLDDLAAGKRTEVDFINGEVVTLAARLRERAPVNETLVRLVHEAEGAPMRAWSGQELRAAVGA